MSGGGEGGGELDGQVGGLHGARDRRHAGVDDDGVNAHVLEQADVARELLLEGRVGHGCAAVLDHHGLAVELADVRKRLEEGGYIPHVVYSALIVTYSCPRSEK